MQTEAHMAACLYHHRPTFIHGARMSLRHVFSKNCDVTCGMDDIRACFVWRTDNGEERDILSTRRTFTDEVPSLQELFEGKSHTHTATWGRPAHA
jgi:hypothetical protein